MSPLAVRCRSCGATQAGAICAKCKARSRRDQSRRRGKTFYQSQQWRDLSAACIARDGACLSCDLSPRYDPNTRLIAHHVIARKDGGSDNLANLITLCQDCHNAYEAAVRKDFRTDVRERVERAAMLLQLGRHKGS